MLRCTIFHLLPPLRRGAWDACRQQTQYIIILNLWTNFVLGFFNSKYLAYWCATPPSSLRWNSGLKSMKRNDVFNNYDIQKALQEYLWWNLTIAFTTMSSTCGTIKYLKDQVHIIFFFIYAPIVFSLTFSRKLCCLYQNLWKIIIQISKNY